MPELKTYKLFISHAWKYGEEYYQLEKLLNNAKNFCWKDYSVPKHDCFKTKKTDKLKACLDEQIRQANCFIVISGMYYVDREFMRTELEIAQKYNKPIVGLIPRGQVKTPTEVQNAAEEMVGWNTESIVSAIRKYSL